MADQAETVVHKTRYLPTKKNLIAARYGSPSLNKGGGGCGGGGGGGGSENLHCQKRSA